MSGAVVSLYVNYESSPEARLRIQKAVRKVMTLSEPCSVLEMDPVRAAALDLLNSKHDVDSDKWVLIPKSAFAKLEEAFKEDHGRENAVGMEMCDGP